MEKPELAPGCFGSALAYGRDERVCGECEFRKGCGEEAAARHERNISNTNAEDVAKALAVKTPSVKKKSKHPAPTVQKDPPKAVSPATPGLPKKAAEVMDRLQRRGIDFAAELRARKNPLGETQSPKFLWLGCELLLGGGFTRKELADRFVADFGTWTMQTATSHVSQVVAILLRGGLAVENADGRISFKEVA